MKRSEINKIMKDAVKFMDDMNFKLPPFAFFSPEEWETKGKEYDEIRENMLGWDITDFGSGDFMKKGLFLFTVRNGNFHNREKYVKPYAEKIMIVEEGQVTPYHFHWSKMEDIINRGGGELVIKVYNSTEDEQFAVYKRVAEMMAGKRVIIRTLDIGADKQADYFGLKSEENPSLGLRAIRICITRP